ncbi:hypothetical protein Q4595_12080 [Wenyingzhuangia sp. 1_MG-2023]|nr:hypothetical protein [Wenyingzhuangia sp. 1_MG-2023]
MNLEIRKEVLYCSLILEESLSICLKSMFEIPSNQSKAMGFQGSALSFKNKVDLLYDINKIPREEYSKFIMFMEIRNQFIHNIDSDNFEIVLKRIDKKNKFLHLDTFHNDFIEKNKSEEKDIEKVYSFIFHKLFSHLRKKLNEIGQNIINEKKQILDQKMNELLFKEYKEINLLLAQSIDDSADDLNIKLQQEFNSSKDFSEIIRENISKYFHLKMNDRLLKKKIASTRS